MPSRRQQGGLAPAERQFPRPLLLRRQRLTFTLDRVSVRAVENACIDQALLRAPEGADVVELVRDGGRARAADVSFDGDPILIREKKRRRQLRTTRRVSLAPALREVLRGGRGRVA